MVNDQIQIIDVASSPRPRRALPWPASDVARAELRRGLFYAVMRDLVLVLAAHSYTRRHSPGTTDAPGHLNSGGRPAVHPCFVNSKQKGAAFARERAPWWCEAR